MDELDWERWPNFTKAEMTCSCGCGRADMNPDFMDRLQAIRKRFGPLRVTSGFRCPDHPVEARKAKPGMHGRGRAVDVAVIGGARMELIRLALALGMRGFGFGRSFQHLDDRENYASWTY